MFVSTFIWISSLICSMLLALVTGGGTGIGKAIAGALALNGCDVYIAARKEALLKETAAELNKAGAGKVEYIVANLNVRALCFVYCIQN